jgi:hypothetical protein
MENPIIGVVGRAGAGKDTVCNMAVDILLKHGIASRRIAVADPIKEICVQVFGKAFGIDPSAFWGSQEEKNAELEAIPGWTGRKILQHVGTEGFRHIHEEVWSKLMYARSMELLEEEQLDAVLVSDVRMLSESELVQHGGGIVVRILRPSSDTGENQGLQGHATELEQTSIKEDFVINNEGRSLGELEKLVHELLAKLHFVSQ